MSIRNNLSMLALAGVLSLPAAVSAQSTVGIKAGLSFATLSNKSPDWDNRNGFTGGLSFDLRAGAIGIDPEVLYVQKGVTLSGSPSSTAPKLDYIETPILFKLTIPSKGIQPFVGAGPTFSFRLSCTILDVDCGNTVKDTDYGVVVGAGLRFGGDKGFTAEGRYSWGLQDVNDLSAGVKSRTRTFLLLAGISF